MNTKAFTFNYFDRIHSWKLDAKKSFTWLAPKLCTFQSNWRSWQSLPKNVQKSKRIIMASKLFEAKLTLHLRPNNKWCWNVLTSWSLVLIWKAVSILDSKSDETEMTRVTLKSRSRVRRLLSLLSFSGLLAGSILERRSSFLLGEKRRIFSFLHRRLKAFLPL